MRKQLKATRGVYVVAYQVLILCVRNQQRLWHSGYLESEFQTSSFIMTSLSAQFQHKLVQQHCPGMVDTRGDRNPWARYYYDFPSILRHFSSTRNMAGVLELVVILRHQGHLLIVTYYRSFRRSDATLITGYLWSECFNCHATYARLV